MENKKELDISWASLWRIAVAFIIAVAVYYVSDIFAVLFLAIVISSALDAPLNYLETKRIPRLLGIIFIFVALLSVLTLLLYTILPIVVLEFKELFNHFDKIQSSLYKMLGISKFASAIKINIDTLSSAVFSGSFSFVDIFPKVFNNVLLSVALAVISFYLTLYRNGIEGFLRAVLPLKQEDHAIDIFYRSRQKIGKWMEGQILLSLIIATVTFIGLLILGVDYSLVLGVLAGIFEIIPFVGPVIAGALAFFIGFSQSTSLGIYVIIFFVIVQQIEAHFLVPVIMRKTTGIHPVIVVISILIGAKIYGMVGVILAVPVVVTLQELVEDYMAHKQRQSVLK